MSSEPPTVDALTSEQLIGRKYRGFPRGSQAAGDWTAGTALLPCLSGMPSPRGDVI